MLRMSVKEWDRPGVLALYEQGVLSQHEAAEKIGVSPRHFRRVYERWQREGTPGLCHRGRGRPSNRAIDRALIEEATNLIYAHYPDFGPTLAAEVLVERHAIELHPETLRRAMRGDGRFPPQRRGPKSRQRRRRRPCFGELVQIDTSIHDWLEGRGPKMVLIAMIDDATSRLWARFFPGDGTESNMALIKDYVERFGRPRAIYCDRASHFVHPGAPDAEQSYRGQRPRTRIGRALDELGIEMIAAHSPQAKGRIERFFQSAQDRLIKKMRLDGVSTLEQANDYLERCFLPWWNECRTLAPAEALDMHRPAEAFDLEAIFSVHETRVVAHDWTLQYGAQTLQIARREAAKGVRPRARVQVEQRLDGALKVRWQGRYLEARVIEKKLNLDEPISDADGARRDGAGSLGLRPLSPAPSGSNRRKPKPDHPWRTGHF